MQRICCITSFSGPWLPYLLMGMTLTALPALLDRLSGRTRVTDILHCRQLKVQGTTLMSSYNEIQMDASLKQGMYF